MKQFKFLTNDDTNPTEEEFTHAVSVGREFYLNGMGTEENPFTGPLAIAFEEGWEMEQDYEIMREAYRRANNETI